MDIKIKLASLVLNDWFEFDELEYNIKNNDYEVGDELIIKTCNGVIYKENSYIVDHVLELLNENAYDVSDHAENYMEDVTREEKNILNERLLDTIRKFQKEFRYEPYFYEELENIETFKIRVLDSEGNYEII